MKGFNPLASLVNEFKTFVGEVREFMKEQREFNKEQREQMLELHAKVDILVAEVSRYKNDSGELLVSVYAYCTVNGIKFSHGDLFKWGGKATRFSRKHGFKIEQTNDPRFGEVNLYEQTVLDNVVEM